MGLRGDKTRILVLHHNVPNMIGQISAVLAKDNMNIADLTNKSKGKYAYTMIDVDSEVQEGVVEELNRSVKCYVYVLYVKQNLINL